MARDETDFAAAMGPTPSAAPLQRTWLVRMQEIEGPAMVAQTAAFLSLLASEAALMAGPCVRSPTSATLLPPRLALVLFVAACASGVSTVLNVAENQRTVVVLGQTARDASLQAPGQELFGLARGKASALGIALLLLGVVSLIRLSSACGVSKRRERRHPPASCYLAARLGRRASKVAEIVAGLGPCVLVTGGLLLLLGGSTLEELDFLVEPGMDAGLAGATLAAMCGAAVGVDAELFAPGGLLARDAELPQSEAEAQAAASRQAEAAGRIAAGIIARSAIRPLTPEPPMNVRAMSALPETTTQETEPTYESERTSVYRQSQRSSRLSHTAAVNRGTSSQPDSSSPAEESHRVTAVAPFYATSVGASRRGAGVETGDDSPTRSSASEHG
ncbi:hypothetical protein FNF31_00993 [Cafeteria roenbergensis]|uniref:Transmembrane protein n=1 Tax=Cafeteria roenbergensis TaxID=33653 RepID=A0A5A8DR38_CAFRO|nr:hypothetical protein FNF31_00993 [Cafeteria roenbergensis]